MPTERLIELPDGAWVRPAEVKSIRPLPRQEGAYLLHAPRVVIAYHGGETTILCESDEDAIAAARRWAAVINGNAEEPATQESRDA